MCFLRIDFSNDAMKPAKMNNHLERVHSDKKSKDLDYSKTLKEKFKCRPNIKTFSEHQPMLMLQEA